MAYSYSTWSQLQTALSQRLGDPNQIFWVSTEIQILLTEALRTFGLLSAFWRERGTLSTVSGTVFYDINTLLSGSILTPTVTDRDIIQSLQYHLLETTAASTQASWTGTEMFTFNDVVNAVQRRLNQFLADTGIVVNRSVVNITAPALGRQSLSDTIIDVRRAAWLGLAPLDYYSFLWRSDERLLTASNQSWSVTAATPEAYSIMSPPPLTLQLAPIPVANGQVELLTVNTGPDLTPATLATVLGIPDDLTPAIKWGALSDLLGIDGIARDPTRAQFAEQQYQRYVRYARVMPVVVHSLISGSPLIAGALQSLESSSPNWENIQGTPDTLVLAAPNLIALSPVPNTVLTITLDVVRKTPIPTLGTDQIQIGREQLDMILDYAEYLALFKVSGAEWQATLKHASDFMIESLTYNQRLSASARTLVSTGEQSQRQKQSIPRRLDRGEGLGSLKPDLVG